MNARRVIVRRAATLGVGVAIGAASVAVLERPPERSAVVRLGDEITPIGPDEWGLFALVTDGQVVLKEASE